MTGPVVLVCGGRDYCNYDVVGIELGALHPRLVIHGGANGADRIAARWCLRTDTKALAYPADWARHGHAAGPIRNQQMLDENPVIDLLCAFPGGSGTADMVRRAQKRGIPVHFPSRKDCPHCEAQKGETT